MIYETFYCKNDACNINFDNIMIVYKNQGHPKFTKLYSLGLYY